MEVDNGKKIEEVENENKQNEGWRRRKKKKRRNMFRSGIYNNDLDDILERFVINGRKQGRRKLDVFNYFRKFDGDTENLPKKHGKSIRSVRYVGSINFRLYPNALECLLLFTEIVTLET